MIQTDFHRLYRIHLGSLCDYYVDYITSRLLKDWSTKIKSLVSPASGRIGVCLGYIIFERSMYKRLADWVRSGNFIMQFPWCVSKKERTMLAIQKEYQANKAAAAKAKKAADTVKLLGTPNKGNKSS